MADPIITHYWGGTQAAYDALAVKSPTTAYLVAAALTAAGVRRITHIWVGPQLSYDAIAKKHKVTLYCINDLAAAPKNRTAHRWPAVCAAATAHFFGDIAVTVQVG